MASSNTYLGNGTITDFAVAFPYLDRTHVVVSLDGIATPFVWVNDATVRVTPAPGSGVKVRVARVTPGANPMVVWASDAPITQANLSLDSRQPLYVSEEARDYAAETVDETLALVTQTLADSGMIPPATGIPNGAVLSVGNSGVSWSKLSIRTVAQHGAAATGLVNDSPAIQEAVDALPAAGGTIHVGPGVYRLDTNVTVPITKPIAWDIDPAAHFTGVGKMPTLITNTWHNASAWARTLTPSLADCVVGHGYSTISCEMLPDASFVGNGVAGYFGARGAPGSTGFVWGLNPLVEFMPGFLGNGIACEVDLANYTSTPYLGEGVTVSGVGLATTGIGVSIKRQDVASRWGVGIRVEYAELGMDIDLSDVGYLAQKGIWVRGIAQNHVVLQPSDDLNPDNAVLYITNADTSVVNFTIAKNGNVITKGGITTEALRIGSVGGTGITKHYSATGTINSGSISPHSVADFFINIPGVADGDSVTASPTGAPAAGIMWSAYAFNGGVAVRLANVTAGAIDPDGPGGLIWRVDAWKH